MNNEIDAFDFISMIVEKSNSVSEVSVEFNKINQLRDSLLYEDIPHDLGFYDFEEFENYYPENIIVMHECVKIRLNDDFLRVIRRRFSITKSVEYKKMLALWKD